MSIHRSQTYLSAASSEHPELGLGQPRWAFERLTASIEEQCALIRHHNATIEESRVLLLEIHARLDSRPISDWKEPDCITRKEAAVLLNCCGRTIDRLADAGELERVRRGRYVRITLRSIEAYIERYKGA